MSIYETIALTAHSLMRKNPNLNCKDAWIQSAKSHSSNFYIIEKRCPRKAYIGLCENGRFKNITRKCSCAKKYSKNKIYANVLAELFLNGGILPTMTIKEIWEIMRTEVVKTHKFIPAKNHNSQIYVVKALFVNGLLK